MIHYILILNRVGKTRLAKWYVPLDDNEKRRVIQDIHRTIIQRHSSLQHANLMEFNQNLLVYRQYAALYFCLVMDPDDNPLVAFEGIHLLVEILNEYFRHVREIDLVENFWKVYAIVDEIFMAGEIMETSKSVVLQRILQLDKE
uniref:AP complex subunit sigma n=1 Tax=Arcella intermedia TaxID=1963864 RepID=A0A6B2LPK5_9EUKA